MWSGMPPVSCSARDPGPQWFAEPGAAADRPREGRPSEFMSQSRVSRLLSLVVRRQGRSRPWWRCRVSPTQSGTGGTVMNAFTSFDGTRIAYHDEGTGPAVVLLHGFGTD